MGSLSHLLSCPCGMQAKQTYAYNLTSAFRFMSKFILWAGFFLVNDKNTAQV